MSHQSGSVLPVQTKNISYSAVTGTSVPAGSAVGRQSSDFGSTYGPIRMHLYQRFPFLRHTAFRIGLVFWLLFTVCFSTTAYVFYQTLESRLVQQIDDSISERYAYILQIYEDQGLIDLSDIAKWREITPMDPSIGFHFSDANGARVAGNIPHVDGQLGWHVQSGADLGLVTAFTQYRFFTGEVDGYRLSVGKSLKEINDIGVIALHCLMATTAISVLLATGIACLFARRVHTRVADLSRALDRVAAGDLNARLPVTVAGDDIDVFAVKINASLHRLKNSVDGMRQVSSDIAHDLKTPLNRLFISIEEAASVSRSGNCVGDDLETALEEANAINGTFNALLRIAQIEARSRKSQFTNFDLADVLSTAVEVYEPVVEEYDQALIVDRISDKCLPMHGDKDLIMQLIVNLIENAVRHSAAGTQIVLSAGTDPQGNYLWFEVADNGPGIPADQHEKVFQRLYRLQGSRTTSGTGLGLSLVKAVADLHGAQIELADNNPGLRVLLKFEKSLPH